MKQLKKYLSMLAAPDRIMDLMVRDRWDTAENPASASSAEPYYYDRSGTLRINPHNAAVQQAFLDNINALVTKKHQQG